MQAIRHNFKTQVQEIKLYYLLWFNVNTNVQCNKHWSFGTYMYTISIIDLLMKFTLMPKWEKNIYYFLLMHTSNPFGF